MEQKEGINYSETTFFKGDEPLDDEEVLKELNQLNTEIRLLKVTISRIKHYKPFADNVLDNLTAYLKDSRDYYIHIIYTDGRNPLSLDMSKCTCAVNEDTLMFISDNGKGVSLVNLDKVASVEIVPKI